MRPNHTTTLPVRLRLRARLDDAKERLALRAALTAAHLLGLAAGRHLRLLRAGNDPLVALKAQLVEAQLQARLAWQIVEVLSSRLAKIPERRRPYYTPGSRFRILELRNLLGWSREIAARVFLVSPNTITNWDNVADSDAKTVGSTVKPTPPVRRFADCVRSLLQLMLRLGFGGHDLVAFTLARAGWKVTPRSVGRIAKEKLHRLGIQRQPGIPSWRVSSITSG